MTAQDVKDGAEAVCQALLDYEILVPSDTERAVFLAALSFIRERADKRFDFEYGSLTSVRNLDAFLSPPSESGP